ncbi:hypothetical protein HFP57_12855 [Parasphingopyxis algicola]|uniref:hypothetical protein n=1 Tax=Parasphingopyxis algicola TaxID=2026624 RepID=UPI0015A0CE09|nr:hypothetical protein [Parasphingopyxis algicola]QLC25821.1 hypothetical protein HFP57_12855 [Parasphingopyxis algicola]
MDSLAPVPPDEPDADTAASEPADAGDVPSPSVLDFTPASPRRQRNGWSAERQRLFVETLAETGCVREAAAAAGMSARSAYRLRARPDGEAFGHAWEAALRLASSRLVALAFDRVVNGMREETWKEGELVATRIRPSERLHLFLLKHLAPMTYGNLSGLMDVVIRDPVDRARDDLAELTGTLADVPPDACPPDPLPFGEKAVIDWRDAPQA